MRGIQVRAAAAAFDTRNHLLLAASTASGKTEAAFLPILTQLYEDPPSTVGALYIGPLKALINDQFLRLNDLCVEADIAVTAWHGDIAASRKAALFRNPGGILQITPEALEGLLLNRSADLMRVFGDLRWIVIDEVHAFMASDRGGQVISLLDRLARYAQNREQLPRRAGLSATLGDYRQAADWLSGGRASEVQVIDDHGARQVYLLVDQFTVRPENLAAHGAADDDVADDRERADTLLGTQIGLFEAAYEATKARKSLIFANSRSDTEEIVTGLRRLAERRHEPDIFFVHHGSISAPLREAAESAMREGDGPACTAATVTLELGIDLGQLDRVLQLGPTATVASFLQRLGRAGRRGQRPEMFFLLREDQPEPSDSILQQLPWELLQTIAVIQLYAEERWIEPIARTSLPGSLLYQQTMSVAAAAGELGPAELAERVLTLAPFSRVSQDNFRDLLRHLVAIDHLERTEAGGLILGLAGEKVVRNFRFLATFADATEWAVKDGPNDIGSIASPVPAGERFALAGRTWEVVDVFSDQKVIIVKRVRGTVRTYFTGGLGGNIHDRVAERMRRVLAEDADYPYLTERASARLAQARTLARSAGLHEAPSLVPLGGDRVGMLPWCGTRALQTLLLRLSGDHAVKTAAARSFYIELTAHSGMMPQLSASIISMATGAWNSSDIAGKVPRIMCERGKYDAFLPEPLLRATFAADVLDVAGAREHLLAIVASHSSRGT